MNEEDFCWGCALVGIGVDFFAELYKAGFTSLLTFLQSVFGLTKGGICLGVGISSFSDSFETDDDDGIFCPRNSFV